MSIAFDEQWEQFLLQNEQLDKKITRVQQETLEVSKTIVSNPSFYPTYSVDAAKEIIKNN